MLYTYYIMSMSRRVINELRRDWTELWQSKNNIFHVKQDNKSTIFQIFFEINELILLKYLLLKKIFSNAVI